MSQRIFAELMQLCILQVIIQLRKLIGDTSPSACSRQTSNLNLQQTGIYHSKFRGQTVPPRACIKGPDDGDRRRVRGDKSTRPQAAGHLAIFSARLLARPGRCFFKIPPLSRFSRCCCCCMFSPPKNLCARISPPPPRRACI